MNWESGADRHAAVCKEGASGKLLSGPGARLSALWRPRAVASGGGGAGGRRGRRRVHKDDPCCPSETSTTL